MVKTTKKPLFQCQECKKKFFTVAAAERATFGSNGCPGCGGSDIEVYYEPKTLGKYGAIKGAPVLIKTEVFTVNNNGGFVRMGMAKRNVYIDYSGNKPISANLSDERSLMSVFKNGVPIYVWNPMGTSMWKKSPYYKEKNIDIIFAPRD